MNTEVIELLCEKLGIAFTSASDFITNILPQYAMMKAISLGGWAVFWLICIIGCIVGAILVNNRRKYLNEENIYHDEDFWVAGTVCFFVLAFIFTVGFLFCSVGILKWLLCPEPMMFDTLLHTLEGLK